MYRSAVNLGSGGFEPVSYLADGGDPMQMDLRATAPGADAQDPYPYAGAEGAMPEDQGPPEEAGLGSVLWDQITGDDVTKGVRNSARVGSMRGADFYGTDPSFMEQLIDRYEYPSVITDLGNRVIPTHPMYPEEVRMARPEGRRDMPTYPELEDARSHMLGSALMAKEYGPETAETAGDFNEFLDRFMPAPRGGQNARDAAMDKRNNAVGRQIFLKAGMNASPQQLTKMVDAEIFKQLDVIMGRSREEQMAPAADQPRAPRNFVSPATGPDVYFPRNEQGYFDTTRGFLGFGKPYNN